MIFWKNRKRKVIPQEDIYTDPPQEIPKVMPNENIKSVHWVCPVCKGTGVIIKKKKESPCKNCKV